MQYTSYHPENGNTPLSFYKSVSRMLSAFCSYQKKTKSAQKKL